MGRFLIRLTTFFFGLLTAVVIVAGGVAAYGREAFWERVAGPADTGAYDFSIPTRTGTPNDTLACPEGACPPATSTFFTPIFKLAPDQLHAEVVKRVAALPFAVIVFEDPAKRQVRTVVRSKIFRFPDTVSVEVRPEGEANASLWIYSRSKIGTDDQGVNAARVKALIDDLQNALPTVAAST